MSRLNIGADLLLDTDYSTSEVKTGATWTDGKPIYRKVFVLNTIVTNNWTVYDSDTTHVPVRVYGRIGTYFIPFYQPDASTYWFILNEKSYKCGAGMGSYTGYIIAEYTKTTD